MAKTNTIALISARAKKIWKKGSEKWTQAISRASKELKKEDLSMMKSTDFNNLVFPALTSTKESLLLFPIRFFAKTSVCTSNSSPAYTI